MHSTDKIAALVLECGGRYFCVAWVDFTANKFSRFVRYKNKDDKSMSVKAVSARDDDANSSILVDVVILEQ